MERRDHRCVSTALVVAMASGLAVPVWLAADARAEEAVLQPASGDQPSSPEPSGEAPGTAPIRFSFKEAPFDEVLDFFSRESGLPIIREREVPSATMTFLSGRALDFEEALSILNLNLRMHNAHLRREENYLYLADLKDAFRKPAPVQEGQVDEDTPPDKVVNVTIPLSNANAERVAEQIKPLLGPNGMVTAVQAQNMVIIVESAAQVRRLGEIIRAIDAEKPVDSQYQLFKLDHAQATQVVEALKSLIGTRERTVIIDDKGKRRVVEEDEVSGVRMQPDPRTNSIVVVGPQSRLDTVKELIGLLDVPEGGPGERQMTTFTLRSVAASEAARHLGELFRGLPGDQRPTVLPLPEVGKITVVGDAPLLVQARALLDEIDPGSGADDPDEAHRVDRVARVIELEHIDPRAAERVAQQMLSPRQQQVLRYTVSPTGRGLLVSGPPGDVEGLASLLGALDLEPEQRADVRLMQIDSPDAAGEIERAMKLYRASGEQGEPEPEVSFDPTTRTVTLIGARDSLERFERLLVQVQRSVVRSAQTRLYDLSSRSPSELARILPRLARPLLEPSDGTAYRAPEFEGIDELDQLIVRGHEGQFETIERLITELDRPDPRDSEFRVIRVTRGQLADVASRARELYDRQAALRPEGELGELRVEQDPSSGSLLVSGSREAVALFDQSLRQSQQLIPPERTTEIIDIQHVDAGELLEPLREMLAKADPIDPARAVPEPSLSVIERTNSMVVTAERAQHGIVRDLIRRLDQIERVDLPPLRLLQLRAADAVSIAGMLEQQYAKRSQADRAARPVEVRADSPTNTLIVSAHEELFEEIRAFVEELNKERREGPERVTVLFNLKVAKAVDVAAAMDKLYPEPPMPRDRRGNPMPWLQKEKEVTVSADSSTNSLIIDAPADRVDSLEQLAEKLDRVEMPPVAELRTFRVTEADLQAVKRTLDRLASQGTLAAPPEPGKKAVPVMIEVEPMSSTLIVAGDETTFERVESVLADLSAVPIERELRIIPIVNADAKRVRERALQIYQAQTAELPDAGRVEVTIDEPSNSLEVVADTESMERFLGVIDQLRDQAGPEREVRLIDLRVARAEEAVSFLDDLLGSSEMFRREGGPEPILDAIESTNTVLISAPPGKLRIIEELIRSLDQSRTAEAGPLRILRLRSTDATNLARVLQDRYDRRPIEDKAKRPVSIQGDAATNTLLVSAHPEMLPEIEAVVRELNEAQAFDAEGREIAVYPLKYARAEELAQTIDAMFPEPPMPVDPRTRRPRPDLRQPKEIVVRADRATNALIVDAPAKRLSGFQELVQSLDTRKLSDDVVLRTYRVERADLGAIQRTLRELADTGALGAIGQTPVTVETEPVTRSLIVSGPEAIFPRVEEVLERFEAKPSLPETRLSLYPLEHARADRLVPLLERVLVARLESELERSGEPMIEVRSLLEVAADIPSNTLLITAPESVHQLVEQLLVQLDVPQSGLGKTIIRVVPLEYANAGDVARTVGQALPSMDLPSGSSVGVIAASSGAAVLLTGTEQDLARVEALIEPLDQRPSDETTQSVETFALEHGDASDIAQKVQRLLEDQLQNSTWFIQQQLRYRRGELPDRATVRVEPDDRTNSLVVSAPEPTLELARAIIERLDAPPTQGTPRIETFTPRQVGPEELSRSVARVLESSSDDPRQAVELLVQPRSQSLVVIGPHERVERALALLARFDGEALTLPALDLRVMPVRHSDPATVARTVERLLRDPARWPEELRRAERAGVGLAQPTVTPEPSAGRILISAPTLLMSLAGELVERLDVEPEGRSTELRVYSLAQGDAASIAQTLERALSAGLAPGDPRPVVTAEPRSNTLVVGATPDQLRHADELVSTMDDSVDTEQPGVRTLMLEHARAESLAPIVEQVLTQQTALDLIPEWARYNYLIQTRNRQGEPTVDRGVKVVAEPRLNAVVVSAPHGMLELAEQIVAELDVERATGGGRAVRVITAVNADAAGLADTIEAVFSDATETSPAPIVRVDRESNSLIVRGSAEQLSRIEQLVGEIDEASLASSRDLRTIRVDPSRADAGAVARSLRDLLGRQGRVRVEIISVEELMDRGTGDASPSKDPAGESEEQSSADSPGFGRSFRPFVDGPPVPDDRPLEGFARLLTIAAVGLIPEQPDRSTGGWFDPIRRDVERSKTQPQTEQGPTNGEPDSRDPVSESVGSQPVDVGDNPRDPDPLAVDSTTNDNTGVSESDDTALPRITIAVDEATNSLIVVGSSRMADRVESLAREIERQMPPEPTSVRIVRLPDGFNPWQVTNVIRATIQQVGNAGHDNPGGFTGRVAATPDPGGGGVIVWANDTDFKIIGRLIGSLTAPEAGPSLTVKVYPLENMAASQATRAVQDLLSPTPSGQQARRMRGLELSVRGPDGLSLDGTIDPADVSVWADPSDTTLFVAAPAESFELIDGFISLVDQSPVGDRLAIRQYPIEHARASDLARTVQQLLDAQRQGRAAQGLARARIVPDDRTNSILATASRDQHEQIVRLIESSDRPSDTQGYETRVFTLERAQASSVQRAVQQVFVAGRSGERDQVQVSADNQQGTLVVRASSDRLDRIAELIERLDEGTGSGLPIRTISLERADAQTAAQSLARLFQERARAGSGPGRRIQPEVAISGDRQSGTLIVAASDEDFATIERLAASFDDRAESSELQVRIVDLEHARVSNMEQTLDTLSFQLQQDLRRAPGGSGDSLYIETNQQTNSVILLGRGEIVDTVERIIGTLDREPADEAERRVRAVTLERADPRAIQRVVTEAFSTPGWRSWWGRDPEAIQVEIDQGRRMVMLIGTRGQVDQAATFIEELDSSGPESVHSVRTIPLKHADAARAAATLNRFLRDRARTSGLPGPEVAIAGSAEGNVLIVSADDETNQLIDEMIGRIDRPELGDDRVVEVRVLSNADPAQVAGTLARVFPERRADERVIVTPQPQTRSVVVSAPRGTMPEVAELIDRLDSPISSEDVSFETVSLESADAAEVAGSLRSSLPESVRVRITPVPRSNSLLLTGSPESIELVRQQIQKLDTEPARTLTEFRRVRLEHAMVDEVWITLTELLRAEPRRPGEPTPRVEYSMSDNTLAISASSDQMSRIESMIEQLDVPRSTDRTTEFVRLEHADAEQAASALQVFYGRLAPEATTPGEQRVTIVPDPASNSLVISAGEAEWEGIRSLLAKLDAPEYDTSRQLVVIPLKHADAASVADALNQGFQASINRQLERERVRIAQQQRTQRDQRDPFFFEPQVLVETDEMPSVAAEALTNSLIVFASRRDLERIEAVVQRLDVADVLKLPRARVIALRSGRASRIAQAVSEMFAQSQRRGQNPRGVRIVGDDASNTLIVRAEQAEFEQIAELVDSLERQAAHAGGIPRVVRVNSVPASRLGETLRRTFAPIAQRQNQPLTIEPDRSSNSLIISAPDALFADIESIIKALDGGPDQAAPAGDGSGAGVVPTTLGQAMALIEIKHSTPDRIAQLLAQMGVTQAQPADRPGLVAAPVRIVPLSDRGTIAVLASPADAETVRRVVRSLDTDPAESVQQIEVVPLRLAEAGAIVRTLESMLDSGSSVTGAGPAGALAEQVRRLAIARGGWDHEDLEIDLTQPIRLIPDAPTNSVVVGSTRGNVAAVREVIQTLDKLPIGEAVTVRIFPLENAAADRVRTVIEELFRRGEAVRRLPGTDRTGQPSTTTGRALSGEIAASVDERTNSLIVAGPEQAIALVEVLIADLDDEAVGNWIEPAVIPLEHADADQLATTLRRVLIEGLNEAPEMRGLQRQAARLRMIQRGRDPFDPGAGRIESDLFAPMGSLSITPEPGLGLLLVVGSKQNIAVVRALAQQLDEPSVAAGNEVRIYPLTHASADRVSQTIERFFDERAEAGGFPESDRVVVSADPRTNSLVITTSVKSFGLIDRLMETLDAPRAAASVSVEVIPVPDADVESLAPKIERLVRERQAASRRAGVPESPGDAFVIEPEPGTQSLIVAAGPDNIRMVRELVEALGTESASAGGSDQTELITLSSGSASGIASALRDLYVDPENDRRGDSAVRVVPNDRLNALIVTGTERDIAKIRELTDRLTNAEVMLAQEIRRFELESANALEVVNLLQTILAGRPIGGGADEQATRLRFIRYQAALSLEDELGRAPVEAEIDGAIRDQVRMTPDLRTNSVLVSAPEAIMTLIGELITDLDQTSAGERRVRTFQLINADARAMRELLIDLFQPRGERTVLLPSYRGVPGAAQPPTPDDSEMFGQMSLTRVTDDRRQLSITIDARTNSLLVSGTEDQLELVEEVVTSLDTVEGTERERVVYHLRNAQADEVETTLREYFTDEAQRIRETLRTDQLGNLSRQLEQEVTIVGDQQSNKLVISASPRYIDTVTQIVRELDAAPPQVVIQVLLAEVTVDSSDTWGLDFEVGPFGGDDYIVGSTPAGAAVATAIGVPSLAVSSGDFDVMIRSLQSRGRLEVLSKPVVTVNNNEAAFIQVGEDIAIVESVDTFEDRTQANVIRRDIGIILNVTPSISADGFVRMEIQPEISDVSARTTQISADFESPIITQRRVDTVVTVKDGQTVVIGGLIETSDTIRRTKVPILGDIPLLGEAFRTHQIEKVKTELMVILTPRIIGGRDAASIERNAMESWRMIDQSGAGPAIRDVLRSPPRLPDQTYEDAEGSGTQNGPVIDVGPEFHPRGPGGTVPQDSGSDDAETDDTESGRG